MNTRSALLIFVAVTFFSCGKHSDQPVPQPVIPPDQPIVKLKDMAEQGLPSPFYHFEYSDSGYITNAVFAGGLSFYDIAYTNKKISEMAMNKDMPPEFKKDKLEYDYNNGSLTGVRVIDKNGVHYRTCLLTFSPSGQLQQLEWDVKADNAANFVKEETLLFSYYADGNVETINYQTYAVGSQTASAYQDKFENYDDKLNADGFSLLHVNPFFLDLVLFPSVHIQVNNPRKVTHSGDGDNYLIDYSYTYDAKSRPVTKNGDFMYTSGPQAGTHANITTTFSYYD